MYIPHPVAGRYNATRLGGGLPRWHPSGGQSERQQLQPALGPRTPGCCGNCPIQCLLRAAEAVFPSDQLFGWFCPWFPETWPPCGLLLLLNVFLILLKYSWCSFQLHFLIGGKLLYSFVLVSVNISLPSWASLPSLHATPLVHHRVPGWAPCVI